MRYLQCKCRLGMVYIRQVVAFTLLPRLEVTQVLVYTYVALRR